MFKWISFKILWFFFSNSNKLLKLPLFSVETYFFKHKIQKGVLLILHHSVYIHVYLWIMEKCRESEMAAKECEVVEWTSEHYLMFNTIAFLFDVHCSTRYFLSFSSFFCFVLFQALKFIYVVWAENEIIYYSITFYIFFCVWCDFEW